MEVAMKLSRTVVATAVAFVLSAAAFARGEAPFVDSATLRQVQQTLQSRGFQAGPVDGVMGPATQRAIRSFQRAENLEVTGQLNSRTLVALGLQENGAAPHRAAYDPALVRHVQQTLTNRGFHAGPVDGVLGAPAREALKRFQQSENLEASGELNPQTLVALGIDPQRLPWPDRPTVGSNAATVRDAQRMLAERGYYTGAIDGIIGPATRAALAAFQRAENLDPTGGINAQTLAALGVRRG
ncbi:MAG TPA: peptidoglycan-binding domain-containing protein [Burkholderiales bacterium]|nr:peptidoglycan-binding domain-containing protein [Burkholderiales bacterium]